jgi:hypothetical protein
MKRQLTEFPEGWALGEPEIATFRKYNPLARDGQIIWQFEKFQAYHEMKGSQFKSWPAAWRTWAMNAFEYGYRPENIVGRAGDGGKVIAGNFGNTGMANLARHLGRGK